jgi:hypothetical protein
MLAGPDKRLGTRLIRARVAECLGHAEISSVESFAVSGDGIWSIF